MSMAWPTVLCAVCKKPVDRMVFFDDRLSGDQVLRVKCHGEWDEMRVNPLLMTSAQIEQLNTSTGYAFTTKRIEA